MLSRLSTLIGTALLLGTTVATAQDAKPVAGDVSGTWTMSWEGPRGPITMQLELKAADETLTGRVETRGGWRDIKDGKVTPRGLAFVMEMGRGDRTFRMQFKGALTEAGDLEGTVSTPRGDDLPWTAQRVK